MGKALWTNLSGGIKPNGWDGARKPHAKKTLRPKTAKAVRQSPPKRKARINPISPKKKEINAEYNKRKRIHLRAFPNCKRCGEKGTDLHHSRGRTGQLLIMAEFFQTLCFACHRWVHDNPKEAAKTGFLDLLNWNRVPEIKSDLNNEGETKERR
jgi:hypothetical protein